MKDEIKIELMKIAAQLTVATVQNKNAVIGQPSSGIYTDVKEIFTQALALVKDQFQGLESSTD